MRHSALVRLHVFWAKEVRRRARRATFQLVDDGVAALTSVFPNARVTSGYRGPNHPLSRANPRSFHTRSHAAVDIAPIPGLTFDQARRRLAEAGYTVHRDSRDEVAHPSSHATGPHWHFVLGKR